MSQIDGFPWWMTKPPSNYTRAIYFSTTTTKKDTYGPSIDSNELPEAPGNLLLKHQAPWDFSKTVSQKRIPLHQTGRGLLLRTLTQLQLLARCLRCHKLPSPSKLGHAQHNWKAALGSWTCFRPIVLALHACPAPPGCLHLWIVLDHRKVQHLEARAETKSPEIASGLVST